ncbi:MAG: CopG family transcriptional regulator [Anaerolineae bacterium]|nr:CopG family transcriptional regulator [Anaerolineae bacterium]
MKRTQIYLPEELHEAVRRISFEQRKSMAQVMREAVAAYVVGERANAPSPTYRGERDDDFDIEPISEEDLTPEELAELKKNPLYHIIGMVSRPDLRDLSERHDYYLLSDPE